MTESKNGMNEQDTAQSGRTEGMKKVTVCVGHCGDTDETRPVRFTGKKVAEAGNRHHQQGPNQTRWHEWELYEVPGGYRVHDHYRSLWQGEADHYSLSEVMVPLSVAKNYPALANIYFSDAEMAEDLD